MTTGRFNQYWTLFIIILVAIIIVGGIVVGTRYSGSQPIEISLPPTQELSISLPPAQGLAGEIYIGGAVSNPGFYPLKAGDTIESLIQAAGGTTSSADLSQPRLYLPEVEEEEKPQKVNLNRAELWLLEALPGIGQTKGQAIIDYRQQNGAFHNINELTKVDGIGTATYEQIKHMITVAD
jgi:competence protein ComEA